MDATIVSNMLARLVLVSLVILVSSFTRALTVEVESGVENNETIRKARATGWIWDSQSPDSSVPAAAPSNDENVKQAG